VQKHLNNFYTVFSFLDVNIQEKY